MFLLRRNRHLVTPFFRQFSDSSAIKQVDPLKSNDGEITRERKRLTEEEIQKIISIEDVFIETKCQQKLPERDALVKNFFIEKVDRDLLAFPEPIGFKDYEKLSADLSQNRQYFEKYRRSSCDEFSFDLSNELFQEFRRKKFFGTSVGQRFGGLGLFRSETSLAAENEMVNVKFAEILGAHRMAAEIISEHGNSFHHNQYLVDLAKGNVVASIVAPGRLSTTQERITAYIDRSSKDDEWVLNGRRSFVVKSKHTRMLVVNVEANEPSEYYGQEDKQKTITLIVDADAHGLQFHPIEDAIGCIEVPYVVAEFNNVRVKKENALLELKDGRSAAEQLVQKSRMHLALLKCIQTRQIFNSLVEHTVRSHYNNVKLREIELYNVMLARVARLLYASESVIYMTNGFIDMYESPKVELESAISLLASHEALNQTIQTILNFPNREFLTEGNLFSEDLRNAQQIQMLGESPIALKYFVGFAGLQHCYRTCGNKVRNYRESKLEKLNKNFENVLNVKSYLETHEFLHPSFEYVSQLLDESIVKLFRVTSTHIHRHREHADEDVVNVRKLGELATMCYSMFASCARASRSYCIGLRHCAYETLFAVEVVMDHSARVNDMASDMLEQKSIENAGEKIAAKVRENKSGDVIQIWSHAVKSKTQK